MGYSIVDLKPEDSVWSNLLPASASIWRDAHRMFTASLLLLTTVPTNQIARLRSIQKALPRLLNFDRSKTLFKTNHFMVRISSASSVRLLAPDYHTKLTSSLLSIAISELFKACNESPVLYVNPRRFGTKPPAIHYTSLSHMPKPQSNQNLSIKVKNS